MRRSSAPEAPRLAGGLRGLAALGLCLALVAGRCAALQLRGADATYADGVFRVTLEAVLDASPSGIESVLTDFRRYRSLDPRIESARLIAREADGSVLVRTRIHACAGIFCRHVDRVERVERRPGQLVATVVPGDSDMRRGVARTVWRPQGKGTLVVYEAEFEPDFWVPKFVGQGLATRALRESTLQMFRNVEREAHAR
jgi:hypothetical protein